MIDILKRYIKNDTLTIYIVKGITKNEILLNVKIKDILSLNHNIINDKIIIEYKIYCFSSYVIKKEIFDNKSIDFIIDKENNILYLYYY